MSDRAILLSARQFDEATIIDHGQEEAGFPVENLQDPSPRTPWRFSTFSAPNNFVSHFVVDLGPDPEKTNYDTFATLFTFIRLGNSDTWRIQTGDDPSGIGVHDSGPLQFWPGPTGELQDDYRSPLFYQPGGTHAFYHLDSTLNERYVRVDYNFTSSVEGAQIGRFMLGLALKPLVLHNSGTPTPVGSPPKLVNTWDMALTQDQRESAAYGLAFDRRSSPRVLRSWGGELFPLDGAKTVLMHNDVLAPDPWTLQQLAVYGYLDPVAPITTRGRRAKARTSITVRGM